MMQSFMAHSFSPVNATDVFDAWELKSAKLFSILHPMGHKILLCHPVENAEMSSDHVNRCSWRPRNVSVERYKPLSFPYRLHSILNSESLHDQVIVLIVLFLWAAPIGLPFVDIILYSTSILQQLPTKFFPCTVNLFSWFMKCHKMKEVHLNTGICFFVRRLKSFKEVHLNLIYSV